MSGANGHHLEGKSATLAEICSVHLGRTLFGIPIRHILEIIGAARPQPVPLAPAFIGGLVHYRGDVLTTVSLRHLLSMPPRDEPQAILVIESGGSAFGLLVDSVGEILSVSSADYEPNPSTLDERRKALFAGAYKLKNQLLVLLDPVLLDPDRLDPVLLEPERLDPRRLAEHVAEKLGISGEKCETCASGAKAPVPSARDVRAEARTLHPAGFDVWAEAGTLHPAGLDVRAEARTLHQTSFSAACEAGAA
jgi:purine-binding chemotaxis protein CheW